MATKKMAIEFLKKLKGKKKKINNVEFTTAVNELMSESQNGFTEQEVDTLVTALVSIENLASTRFQAVLKCIVPYGRVSSETALKMLSWVFTYYRSAPPNSISLALEWIIGLVEFGLTDEVAVHSFYNHFYVLLQHEKLVVLACKLIHLLTNPSDVFRWRVSKILKTEQKYGKKNHTNSLLCLFKSYKPECVPEKVPAMNLQFAFKNIGKMNPAFHKAQLRLRAAEGEIEQAKKLTWNIDQGMKKTRSKMATNIVPPIDYVHFESRHYREKYLYSLLEFKNLQSLSRCQLRLDIPCYSMSLLQNVAGFHIITFGDKSLQSRFSYNLYCTLYKAFIEQVSTFSYGEKENLLKQVAMLEEYMQQGIPVVSRFLAEYLHMWDGEDFRETIFHLLQWITPSSYCELHSLILSHIYTLFLMSDVQVKCSIIRMLGRLIRNIVSVGLFRKHNEIAPPFLEINEEWSDSEMLQNIGQFTSDLCALGLTLEQADCMLLHEALNFFEMITSLESNHKLEQWTVIPPAVVYSALFSSNAVFLARVCDLLLKYATFVCPRLRMMGLKTKFLPQVNLLELYFVDFINCLCKGNCFDKRDEGYIFNAMSKAHVRDLARFVVPNEVLLLQNHFCMLPYITLMKKDCSILHGAFDQNDLLIIASKYFQEIYDLIEFVTNNSQPILIAK